MAKPKSALAKGFKIPAAPKRTPVPEEKAAPFVEPKPKTAAAPKPSAKRRTERGERVTFYLPSKDVETQLRMRCAKEGRSVSDALTELVEAWLRTER